MVSGVLEGSKLEGKNLGFFCGDVWCGFMAPEKQPLMKPLDDMMKNLKVDPSSATRNDTMAAQKERSPSDATSCISSLGDMTGSAKESDVDQESLMADQGFYYPGSNYCGYYYPGYDAFFGEFDEQRYIVGCGGLEMQCPVIQADNGSLVYYMPEFQPSFSPYDPSMPATIIGVDGQYLGLQSYIPNSLILQPFTSPGGFPYPVQYGTEVVPGWSWDPSRVGDANHGNGTGGVATITDSRLNVSSAPSHSLPYSKPASPSKPSTPHKTEGSLSPSDVPPSAGVRNQSFKPINKGSAVLSNGYVPIANFTSYANKGKSGMLYLNGPVNIKANGQSWGVSEKLKSSGNANGVNNFDLLNEQSHHSRTNGAKNTWQPSNDFVENADAKVNGNANGFTSIVKRDQFNQPDFPTKYDSALFFVIKSYSEDDIHKSIKYCVWTSTPNGNKKLDGAYQDAHERTNEKGSKCPVFLLFSVNASGQFCGLAEMSGRVDFNKNMDFWHQDKWTGCFPVKWHIIKDIPNSQFRHILLENNDNKPVTNSRDAQEVNFPQGIEMLNIFKNYSAMTSIMDDFEFYEGRQKAMQGRWIKPAGVHSEHLQSTELASSTMKGETMVGNGAMK